MDYYNDTDAISKSGLDKIASSPLDYWYKYLRPDREPYVPDKKQIFDDALRCAVFTPAIFANKYVKTPVFNRSTNVGKSEYAALARAATMSNQILLDSNEYETIRKMQETIMQHPVAQLLFASGSAGMPTRFHEQNTGAIVKFQPHFIHASGMIVNLMSIKDATQESFSKESWNQRLDKKAALQMDGVDTGEGFVYVNVEATAPFKIGISYLDQRSIDFGRDTYIRNCETYVQCLESGKWPGLPAKITEVSLPNWVFKN